MSGPSFIFLTHCLRCAPLYRKCLCSSLCVPTSNGNAAAPVIHMMDFPLNREGLPIKGSCREKKQLGWTPPSGSTSAIPDVNQLLTDVTSGKLGLARTPQAAADKAARSALAEAKAAGQAKADRIAAEAALAELKQLQMKMGLVPLSQLKEQRAAKMPLAHTHIFEDPVKNFAGYFLDSVQWKSGEPAWDGHLTPSMRKHIMESAATLQH